MALACLIVATALCALLGNASACVPPDCDRPDLGTCVNACCKLQFSFSGLSGKALVSRLAQSIATGGPDGRYHPVENNTVQPWSSETDFVVQAVHSTAKYLYNDTLHLAVQHSFPNSAVLFAFSHSQDFIKGNFAFGDHGQNYKNLVGLVKGLKLQYVEKTLMGCPEAHKAVHLAHV
mmetsp:Transcript_86149/g.171050  ORF Transcript_86149/g.171050 Transcript_86149/m.171050 type:complete len:177 (-) Transcript_86149:138-668(-)|eukprot:CAMPEP_0172724922 /NCGR_PEP_ID=MMETSP1074-20121228/87178_1 /TAXON_ID=2916 /ORGANISM="Ceratium fusus, Strain PA161109" /LENGTH=176 /DNA_ID=CAMNT_0013551555 /DNA_START=40 /DNA_END=570 /DNA_ORIENTATION=+